MQLGRQQLQKELPVVTIDTNTLSCLSLQNERAQNCWGGAGVLIESK